MDLNEYDIIRNKLLFIRSQIRCISESSQPGVRKSKNDLSPSLGNRKVTLKDARNISNDVSQQISEIVKSMDKIIYGDCGDCIEIEQLKNIKGDN